MVAAITPYNFPLQTNVWKVFSALAAGCPIVLRPSPLTPLSALVFGLAAVEADLPEGVLNVIVEAGAEGAELLSKDPRIDCVSFTGSTTVGRQIAAQAAATVKRLVLELGGKSVQLYLPDALDGVVAGVCTVFGSHAGQACAAQARALVPEDRLDEVVERIAGATKMLQVGDPQDPKSVVGPLISAAQRDRVERLVEEGIAAGARLVTGGQRPPHLERGYYYEPTVLVVDDNSNPVAQRIRSGTVQVNRGASNAYTPMGGVKQSGLGRERGVADLREYQEIKHIVVGSAAG